MKKFDVVATNPPFQDRARRRRTPHKLWIDFTRATFDRWLAPGGLLLQVSPASFRSPSSKVLPLMRTLTTDVINFDVEHHFPGVGSSFAYYAIYNRPHGPERVPTTVTAGAATSTLDLNDSVAWLPTDLCATSLSIHSKVLFSTTDKLDVRHDYVTCHNITLGDTLSKTATEDHPHPVFHTNPQVWYSSVRQDWADLPKVMWSRSGYTRPRFDDGVMGGTDMVYYVPVPDADAGETLVHNLNLPLFRYLLRTAKWSGFGNELVFASLPDLPADVRLTHEQSCALFQLTEQEADYVLEHVG